MALFHHTSAWACALQFFLFILPLILAVVSFIQLCSTARGTVLPYHYSTQPSNVTFTYKLSEKKTKLGFYGQKYD